MCKRGTERKALKKRKYKANKKLTCCQKCRRRIRIWLCRRLKRCVKRIIFGDPDPHLEEFEIVGVNLGNVRDTLKRNISVDSKHPSKIITEKKPTVKTLFRNTNKSTQSIPMKDTLANEWDALSFSKSLRKKFKSIVSDFREYNIHLPIANDSTLYLDPNEKEEYKKLAEKYEKKNKTISQKHLDFLKNIEMLKRKFSLSASKIDAVKNMVEDYNTGKFTISKISHKSKFNINKFDKKDLNKILAHYESEKKKKKIFFLDNKNEIPKKFVKKIYSKNVFNKYLENLKNMDDADLKKQFPLTGSKQKDFKRMMDDYKKGTFSLSKIENKKMKIDQKKFNKTDINEILDYYKTQRKNKHNEFIKQSKLKQLKSDLKAKIDFL